MIKSYLTIFLFWSEQKICLKQKIVSFVFHKISFLRDPSSFFLIPILLQLCDPNVNRAEGNKCDLIKGCGMGPLRVSPCFGENVVTTCKIGSFLCSLDNLLQKNVIVFFLGNQISKWRSFEKRAILTYFSHFLVTREKLQKFLRHISHSHTHMYFTHPIDFFCLTNFEKK